MKSNEIRDLILEYLQGREYVKSMEVRAWLLEKTDNMGKSFTINNYSNAMTSLINKGMLEPTDIKGYYKVLKNLGNKEKNKKFAREILMKTALNKEEGLKEMRREVQEVLDGTYMKIEQIFDSIKPSVYAENVNTYERTIEILYVLNRMKYPMDCYPETEEKVNGDVEKSY